MGFERKPTPATCVLCGQRRPGESHTWLRLSLRAMLDKTCLEGAREHTAQAPNCAARMASENDIRIAAANDLRMAAVSDIRMDEHQDPAPGPALAALPIASRMQRASRRRARADAALAQSVEGSAKRGRLPALDGDEGLIQLGRGEEKYVPSLGRGLLACSPLT